VVRTIWRWIWDCCFTLDLGHSSRGQKNRTSCMITGDDVIHLPHAKRAIAKETNNITEQVKKNRLTRGLPPLRTSGRVMRKKDDLCLEDGFLFKLNVSGTMESFHRVGACLSRERKYRYRTQCRLLHAGKNNFTGFFRRLTRHVFINYKYRLKYVLYCMQVQIPGWQKSRPQEATGSFIDTLTFFVKFS
jgi:hypothetical protein